MYPHTCECVIFIYIYTHHNQYQSFNLLTCKYIPIYSNYFILKDVHLESLSLRTANWFFLFLESYKVNSLISINCTLLK